MEQQQTVDLEILMAFARLEATMDRLKTAVDRYIETTRYNQGNPNDNECNPTDPTKEPIYPVGAGDYDYQAG